MSVCQVSYEFRVFLFTLNGTSNRQIGKYTEVNVKKLDVPTGTFGVKFCFDFSWALVVLVAFPQHCIILAVLAVYYRCVLILVVWGVVYPFSPFLLLFTMRTNLLFLLISQVYSIWISEQFLIDFTIKWLMADFMAQHFVFTDQFSWIFCF